jgi:hypothetical protein
MPLLARRRARGRTYLAVAQSLLTPLPPGVNVTARRA